MEAAPAPFSPMARFIRCPSPVMTTRQFTTGTWITATSIPGRWLKTSPEAAWTHGMEFAWTPMSGGPRCPAGCHPAAQRMAGHIRTDRRSGGAFGEAGRGDRGCVPAHRLPGRRRVDEIGGDGGFGQLEEQFLDWRQVRWETVSGETHYQGVTRASPGCPRCRPNQGAEFRGRTPGWPGRGRGEAGLGPVGEQPGLSPLHRPCPPGGGLASWTRLQNRRGGP